MDKKHALKAMLEGFVIRATGSAIYRYYFDDHFTLTISPLNMSMRKQTVSQQLNNIKDS